MVKRVVALPGQEIEIAAKQLYLDGQRVDEPWAGFRDSATFSVDAVPEVAARRDNLAPMILPPGYVFLLGDNRDESYDSRFFGPVAKESVTGEALYVYWSSDLKRVGHTVR